jgi:hypothetical protein
MKPTSRSLEISKLWCLQVEVKPSKEVQFLAIAVGLLALPMVGWSELTLKTTGTISFSRSIETQLAPPPPDHVPVYVLDSPLPPPNGNPVIE